MYLCLFVSMDEGVVAHIYIGACFESGFNDGSLVAPLCLTDAQERPPIGCVTPSKSQSECDPFYISAASNWWWTTWLIPAMSESECIADVSGRRGCLLPGSELHLDWFNNTDCACMNGEMRNAWKWTSGQWVGGQSRPMIWVRADPTSRYTWNASSLSFAVLTSWLTDSIEELFLYPIKSESLCSSNIVTAALDAVACDCLAADSPRGE